MIVSFLLYSTLLFVPKAISTSNLSVTQKCFLRHNPLYFHAVILTYKISGHEMVFTSSLPESDPSVIKSCNSVITSINFVLIQEIVNVPEADLN